ncbi:helix-turn-helix transcriptional regulator [Pseudoxanthomonas putridarboris]|uniref:Helix-turn-helix transcriptional regulator n=1 Tax=Pseudoxanthomonas putridarboris TaxID=752605 RepID=A0ABU9J372_9GAMM
MVNLSTRIRRARTLSRITQSELAKRIDVKRSAVSQWESALGTTPSVSHLIQIALETGVCFEWLATGRGPARLGQEAFGEAVILKDFAQDELESRGLVALGRLSRQKKLVAVAIIELLSGVTAVEAETRSHT